MNRSQRIKCMADDIHEILVKLPNTYPPKTRGAILKQLEISARAILLNLRSSFDVSGGKSEKFLKTGSQHG